MNGRFLPTLSLVILVAGVANPRIAAPDPLPSEPPAPSSGVPVSPPVAPTPTEAYPAAIQTLLDRGGRLAGRGMVGDLPFWTIETPAGQQTYVTSPRGLVIQGQLYDSGGLLKLDTAAAVPVIADPARQRREGLQPLLGGTNTVLPPTAGLADGSPPAAARDDSLAAVETLIRGATGPEAVWADLGQATTIEEGARDAPLVYVFIDPYCPYCHQQWRLLRQTITDGRLRVRWVPVVVLEASKRQLPRVLGLLPPTDAEGLARWMTHHVGEFRTDAQAKLALARNQALFGRLQANKVPALLYRAADGRVVLRAGLSPLAPAVTAQ
jgi:thiol:disulfide interchange protein DsbG